MRKQWLALVALCALYGPLGVEAAPTRVSANHGEVRDLKWATGDTLYAASYGGGLFKSTDKGVTWSHLAGLAARYLQRVAISPGDSARVYVAGETGLFRSTDSGSTWTQLTYDPASAIGIDPSSTTSDTLLIGVPGSGIVKVTAANSTPVFTRASSGLDSTEVVAIEYQSASIAVAGLACNYQDVTGTLKEGNYGGVFRTTDNGTSWNNINTLGGQTLPSKCVRALAVNASTILVGTFDSINASGKLHRSTSLGPWSQPAGGNPYGGDLFGVFSIKIDRNSSSTFWGGSSQVGLWKSIDSGASWIPATTVGKASDGGTPNELSTGINAIETVPGISPYRIVIAPRGIGVYTSTSTTTPTWTKSTGLTADRVRGLTNHAVAAKDTYYAAIDNGGVIKSTDAGATWAVFNAGLDNAYGSDTYDRVRTAQVIAAHPSDITQVGVGLRSLGLYSLSGSSWARVLVFANAVDHKPQSLVFNSTGVAYYSLFDSGATTPGGLFRGATLSSMTSLTKPIYESSPGLGVAPGAYKVVVSPNSDNRVYFLMYDSEPYRATDGTSFSRVTVTHEGFMRIAFYDVAEKPGNANVVVGATNKGVFRSSDGGASFSRLSITGLTDFGLSSIAYAADGKLFGGTLGGGFFCSKDDGSTWQAVSLGSLPAVGVREVRYLNGQIHWLTDGGGIYKSTSATDCP